MNNSFRVIAIIAAFNEEDIISSVIRHLVDNGIDAYLIDNHSTDDTVKEASEWLGRGLVHIERFPQPLSPEYESPGPFDWSGILRRKEELATELSADWLIHHDADEIRESPWPGLTLKEAIRWVDKLGYNCINFQVLNFCPVDDSFQRGDDPRNYFTLFEEAAQFDKVQLKCWKVSETHASLVPSGGHEVRFEGRRVFPISFLNRHYPIRGQRHGLKKVFAERKKRFLESERSKGWHIQYDQIKDENHYFLRDPVTLRPFNLFR
jgi:glycosyltransferase involved in cell wall biosynthesis